MSFDSTGYPGKHDEALRERQESLYDTRDQFQERNRLAADVFIRLDRLKRPFAMTNSWLIDENESREIMVYPRINQLDELGGCRGVSNTACSNLVGG
jgi:hypothetical protein